MSTRLHELTFLSFCATACLIVSACGGWAANAAVSDRVEVTVAPSNKHPISPYIYGINFASKIDGVPTDLTLDRSGGNRWTAYNWETNASNAGSDYQYQNDGLLSSSNEPAAAVSALIAEDRKKGMASLITVQAQGWVAADENGPVNVANPPDRTRFKKVYFEKKLVSNDPFTDTPPTSDDYVFMDEFLWALDHKFAGKNIFGATPPTPVFVSLDNEPELWNRTHLEIQGKTGIPAQSYIAASLSLATALKKQFPDVVIFGPAHYGFMGIYSWNGELSAAAPNGNNWFTDKYLTSVKAASTAFGRPLVDVYDFHWYPEATDPAGARINTLMGAKLSDEQVQAIVQSPRSLWDKTYKEKSWIVDMLGQPIDLLDRLQSRIDAENPGMKLAISEYNNGGGQHIAGTIAQADNLGLFGTHAVFAASMWLLAPKEPYSLAGFRAFRNFDGADHHFGDTALQTTSSNPSAVVAYVSIDSTRAGRVVMVAINRSPTDQVASITGQPLSGTAHLFQMTAATAAKQSAVRPVAVGVQPASGTSITLNLPALSVTTVDIY